MQITAYEGGVDLETEDISRSVRASVSLSSPGHLQEYQSPARPTTVTLRSWLLASCLDVLDRTHGVRVKVTVDREDRLLVNLEDRVSEWIAPFLFKISLLQEPEENDPPPVPVPMVAKVNVVPSPLKDLFEEIDRWDAGDRNVDVEVTVSSLHPRLEFATHGPTGTVRITFPEKLEVAGREVVELVSCDRQVTGRFAARHLVVASRALNSQYLLPVYSRLDMREDLSLVVRHKVQWGGGGAGGAAGGAGGAGDPTLPTPLTAVHHDQHLQQDNSNVPLVTITYFISGLVEDEFENGGNGNGQDNNEDDGGGDGDDPFAFRG
jgi:hypothetical protein